MTRHTPSDSPCGDPTHSQHRLSPAESKIQNQEIDFPPEARLGYVMTRHTPSTCKIQNLGACLCLVRILSRIQGEGAEFKIKNQPGPLEGMVNDGQNPESRIMRGGSWLRKESKLQSSIWIKGMIDFNRKEKRIQSSELEGTLERERKRRISYWR